MAIADVIKYEGDNSTFIWKHPSEDFNSLSQLIVHESQEAIFFMNGQALDLFGPGRYTLDTQNIPLVGQALKLATDGVSAFHCEVYFINKTEQMSVKWGTDSKVEYVEPTYGFPLRIGASGEMSLRAEDSRKLLLKLVGTEKDLSRQKLTDYFRAFLMTRIKTYIAQTIREQKINIFEIDERLADFSENLKALLVPDFADYGVALERFFVTNIARPDGERDYEKFKELHFRQYADIAEARLRQKADIIYAQTEAQKTVIASQAMAAKRAQEGYTYQQERGFDVAERVAQNEAIGQFTNMGVGLGTMAGVGGAVGGMVGGAVSSAMDSAAGQPADQPPGMFQGARTYAGIQEAVSSPVCVKCGAPLPPGARFCLNCGEKQTAAQPGTVVCPKCGKTVVKARFCPECGYKMTANCPKCGRELEPGTKFCPECGEKME